MTTVSAAGSPPPARVDDADVHAPAAREPQRGGRLIERDVPIHEVEAPTLVSVLLAAAFRFGLQLVVVGMLGGYVARVLEEVQHRPIFVVDELVGLEAPPAAPHARVE